MPGDGTASGSAGDARLSALCNRGIVRLGAETQPPPSQRTLVVLGAARGGTSMVASALHALGVPMGENLGVVFEDVELGEAVERRDRKAVARLVAERNARFDVWGWKRPSAVDSLGFLEGVFRHPRYVVVFRDLLAIANRNRIAVGRDLLTDMRATAKTYEKLVRFIGHVRSPCLLLSYEKAMIHRDHLLRELAEFAGVEASGPKAEAALEGIRRAPGEYLWHARLRSVLGFLDQVHVGGVAGWARFTDSDDPVVVEILVNGKIIGRVHANEPRPDVQKEGLHRTGRCGFSLRFSADKTIAVGDQIEARVVGGRGSLNNSPRVFG